MLSGSKYLIKVKIFKAQSLLHRWTTNCETGCSQGNVTGASPSRSCTLLARTRPCLFLSQICPSYFQIPTTSNRPERLKVRWSTSASGLRRQTLATVGRRSGTQTQCLSGLAPAGTTCGLSTPRTTACTHRHPALDIHPGTSVPSLRNTHTCE